MWGGGYLALVWLVCVPVWWWGGGGGGTWPGVSSSAVTSCPPAHRHTSESHPSHIRVIRVTSESLSSHIRVALEPVRVAS